MSPRVGTYEGRDRQTTITLAYPPAIEPTHRASGCARAWGTPGGSWVWNLKPGAIDTFLRREMDLLDAKTSRHTGNEFASETDAAVVPGHLEGQGRARAGGYWWVECGSCEAAWQGCALRRERRVTNESAAAPRWVGRCLPGAIFLGRRTYPPYSFRPIPAR
jgi:hypothetical protein